MLSFDLWEQVPKLAEGTDYLRIAGTLSEPEILVLAGVDGRATLRQIIVNLRYDRDYLTRIVARLAARRVLAFADPQIAEELTAEAVSDRLDFAEPGARKSRPRAAEPTAAAPAEAESVQEFADEAAAEIAGEPAPASLAGVRFAESGEWTLDSFFRLLGRFYVERRDGVLRIYRDRQTHKAFYLLGGRIANIVSVPFSAGECLGRLAQRAGLIDQAAVIESLTRARKTGRKQGEALAAMGALSADKVDNLLRVQLEVKATPILDWQNGTWTFDDAPLPARLPPIKASTPRLLFNLAWKRYPVTRMDAELKQHLNDRVGYCTPPTYRAADFEFGEAVREFVTLATEKDIALQRLLGATNIAAEQAERLVWSLYLLGVVGFFHTSREERLARRLADLAERWRAMERESSFENLQVHWSAGQATLNRAVARLSAETEHAIEVGNDAERELLTQIRDRLRRAAKTLRTPEGRRKHREKLYDPATLAAGADALRQKGETALFIDDDPLQAASELEAAREIDEQDVEVQAELGLALVLRDLDRDGPGVAEGGRLLREASAAAPNSGVASLCEALMHRAVGDSAAAVEAIDRATRLEAANAFVRALAVEIKTGNTPRGFADAARQFVERARGAKATDEAVGRRAPRRSTH